jgi:cysteine-rich repeat protein
MMTGALLVVLLIASASMAGPLPVCGNGVIEPPETCDDGNVVPGDGCSHICTIELPANLPPDCSGAEPSVARLWPPNHRLEAVHILGVRDPEGGPVDIEVVAIAQSEPVLAEGSGNTCPDAGGIGTETALVRVERAGPGDGRTYFITFDAVDELGAVCRGDVVVCVPHDQGRGSECGGGVPAFDSVAPCPGDGLCDPLTCIPDDDDLPPPFCGDLLLPPRIDRLIDRARELVLLAVDAPVRRATRLERRAARKMARAARRAERLGLDDATCASELTARLAAVSACLLCPGP